MLVLKNADVAAQVLPYISRQIRGTLENLPEPCWKGVEEIRLGVQRPVAIYHADDSFFVTPDARQTTDPVHAIICSKSAVEETLSLLTKNSLYAYTDKLRNGFLTLTGGHRAGIVGTAVTERDTVLHIKEISGINLRIRREIKGFAEQVMDAVAGQDGIRNTLIVSPPRCGKTTLLRDVARILGQTRRIGLLDERGEIAAMEGGVAQNDVGVRTEVLAGCPKAVGMMMLVRSMSPEVILTDELGLEEDALAIRQVLSCGVKLIATAHGANLEDIRRRRLFADLLPVFETVILLSNRRGTGTVERVLRRDSDDF